MSKTIEIKKVHIRNLFLSVIVGFGILFGLEHFGQFSYKHNYVESYQDKPSFETLVPGNATITYIKYITYFGNEFQTNGNGFTMADLNFSDTEFNKYSTKSYYYTQATIKDMKYGIYISSGLFVLTLFFTNFKFKLT